MINFDAADVVRRLTARLKMRHLQLLLRILQHRSLTRVAEEMATSQPAVTNALAEVEGMFGAPLFDRSTRGMAPTPLGKVVLARAQAMINDLGHLVRDMETVATGNAAHRSEEHTSELQSLMRNSYAVFCLKKQKKYQ